MPRRSSRRVRVQEAASVTLSDPVAANPSRAGHSGIDLWICAALLLATFAVYAQVRHFAFVNFDDPDYVSGNSHVRNGLTPESVSWAFTSGEAANWFPVTRLSHILDVQLFGQRSGLHHLVNVSLHALATLVLFAFLKRATDARWPSAFVAFLFALHPLHVESVAWVAERKDVLCALFWFLALWAYVFYAERPSARRYLLVVLPFCLGLMAKPMIVTLPVTLLLLDLWPLKRWPAARVVREKIPLFALSGAAALITFLVQRSSGAVESLAVFPLGLRIENALVSCVVYIGRMLWPASLAVFYPYPADIPLWEAAFAAAVLTGISILALRAFRNRPYFTVGWFWYLVTLAPVIGIIQAGAQARADRYMYVPMVGLSILLAWGVVDLATKWPRMKPVAFALGLAACAACAAMTWVQLQYWQNSETLFAHALRVTDGNYLAEHNLGNALLGSPARSREAIAHLEAAVRIKPDSSKAQTDLGSALAMAPGRVSEAIPHFEAALRMDSDSAITHNNLGSALSKIPGQLPQAIAEYETALRLNPDYAEAHENLAVALAAMPDRLPQAIVQYQEAIRLNPDFAEAHLNLGSAFSKAPGRLPEAIMEYSTAVQLEPGSAETHYDLGVALSKEGRLPEAISQLEAALRINPDYAEAHNNLGVVLSSYPDRSAEAISHFEAAVRIQPSYAGAHYNLGVALSSVPGRMPEAIAQFEAVERIKPDPQVERVLDQLRRR